MKINILKSAIFAVAATATVGVTSVQAYDSGAKNDGLRGTEWHSVRNGFEFANSPVATGAEVIGVYSVVNTTVAAPSVEESYTRAYDFVEDTIVRQEISNIYLPAAGGLTIANGNDQGAKAYDFTTREDGKIISGWIETESVSTDPGNPPVYSFMDFTAGDVGTWQGCGSVSPTFAESRNTLDNGLTPGAAGAVAATCALVQHGLSYYETCDIRRECGQLNKSVPVPAFAAAALGLGLVGITLLTSRRRSVK